MANLILLFTILLVFLWLLQFIGGWFGKGETKIAYVRQEIQPQRFLSVWALLLLIIFVILVAGLITPFVKEPNANPSTNVNTNTNTNTGTNVNANTVVEIQPTTYYLRTTCSPGLLCRFGEFEFTIEVFTNAAKVIIPEGASEWRIDCAFVDAPELYTIGIPEEQVRWQQQPQEQRVKIFQLCENLNLTPAN